MLTVPLRPLLLILCGPCWNIQQGPSRRGPEHALFEFRTGDTELKKRPYTYAAQVHARAALHPPSERMDASLPKPPFNLLFLLPGEAEGCTVPERSSVETLRANFEGGEQPQNDLGPLALYPPLHDPNEPSPKHDPGRDCCDDDNDAHFFLLC